MSLHIKHVFLGTDPKRPIATREGKGQLTNEMWVGNSNDWQFLGLTSTTMEIEKNLREQTMLARFRYILNGTPLIERVYEVVHDTFLDQYELGALIRERHATIGELE